MWERTKISIDLQIKRRYNDLFDLKYLSSFSFLFSCEGYPNKSDVPPPFLSFSLPFLFLVRTIQTKPYDLFFFEAWIYILFFDWKETPKKKIFENILWNNLFSYSWIMNLFPFLWLKRNTKIYWCISATNLKNAMH